MFLSHSPGILIELYMSYLNTSNGFFYMTDEICKFRGMWPYVYVSVFTVKLLFATLEKIVKSATFLFQFVSFSKTEWVYRYI